MIKNNPIFKLASAALMAACFMMPQTASAVNAYPGPIKYTQPDGSTLNVVKVGSEYGHYLLSEDGLMLVQTEMGVCYAAPGADNAPVSSGILAHNPQNRIASEVSFLSTVNNAAMIQNRASEIDVQNKVRQAKKIATRATDKGYPGLFTDATFPLTGSPKALVILAEFKNLSFEQEDPQGYFDRMLNAPDFSDNGATISVGEWHNQNSYGKFTPEFKVYGPVKLKKNYQYYGNNDTYGSDMNATQMIIDACKLLDDEIDFSEFDNDGDGIVDNVYVYYAGYGEAFCDDESTIWPHQSNLDSESIVLDGVTIDYYGCSSEIGYWGITDGVGTFLHEFSHVLGLPDLYCTTGAHNETPGSWDIMDNGNYNNDGRTPPNYSSFEKYALGWITPEVLHATGDYTLPEFGASGKAYIVYVPDDETEYYIFENRQKVGNDAYLPGTGMLVWHVDYTPVIWDNNIVNNTKTHQYVDLIEADSSKPNSSIYNAYKSFPGRGNITQFTRTGTPAFVAWNKNKNMGMDFYNIAENNGVISFHVSSDSGVEENFVDYGEVLSVKYYDLSGRAVANPADGIFVKVSAFANGKTKTEKVVLK